MLGDGDGLRGEGAQHFARLRLQRAIRAFPLAFARAAEREASHEREQRIALARGLRALRFGRVELGGIHQLDPAILANADAVLRRFQSAAADALPRLHPLAHRYLASSFVPKGYRAAPGTRGFEQSWNCG